MLKIGIRKEQGDQVVLQFSMQDPGIGISAEQQLSPSQLPHRVIAESVELILQ